MPETAELNKALLDLESELNRFKSAKETLDLAQAKAERLLKKWEELQTTHDKAIQSVYHDTVQNSQAVRQTVTQFKDLGRFLIKLAKAVEETSFPARLDKLDANISTATLALQSLQNRFDAVERNLTGKVDHSLQTLASEIKSSSAETVTAIRDEAQSVLMQVIEEQKRSERRICYWLVSLSLINMGIVSATLYLAVRYVTK